MTQPQDPTALAVQAMIDGDVKRALALTETAQEETSTISLCVRSAALLAAGDKAGARRARDSALVLHLLPTMAEQGVDVGRMANDGPYALQVGRQHYNAHQMGAATLALGCAMNDPDTILDAVFIKAQAEHYLGRVDEALASFETMMFFKPSSNIHSFILYTLFFVEDNVRRQAEEAARYNDRWTPTYAAAARPLANDPNTDRKLRIGYMGPTCTTSHASLFIQPLLEHHDLERFEVFTYVLDAEKETPIPGVQVRGIRHVAYADTAQLIRDDGIDVLVDMHGHAANARPMVLACRAAPVQVSWLNWHQTTGLAAMDYVIHCDNIDPPDPSLPMPEQVIRVGPTINGFRPYEGARSSPCPALSRGHVTFASFNHPAKLSDLTVAMWSRILKRVPGAKLHLKSAGLDQAATQLEITIRFLACGVPPDALEFSGFSKGDAYEEAFTHIDLALDTQPHPGGTTTLDAVARGVPVLVLNGPNFYAQMAVPAMIAMGLDELIAWDWDEYIDKAVAYANDIPRLAALRERVQPAFAASSLRDEAGFARRMEEAYLQMFAAWAVRQAAEAA